jgi:hypothetical protein
MPSPRITREQFNLAMEAIWSEIQYQDQLPLRTDDSAKDVPGFITLGRRYIRKLEDDWADNPGEGNPCQVPQALHGLRKVAAVFTRAMICNGVRVRGGIATNDGHAETTPRGDEVRSEPVLYVVWYDGDDTPYAASCSTTEGECKHYFLLPHGRKGKVVPLYSVPVDAAREIAAARREAEEARAECERLRITDDEREAIAVTCAYLERIGVRGTSLQQALLGLLARHDKGGAA